MLKFVNLVVIVIAGLSARTVIAGQVRNDGSGWGMPPGSIIKPVRSRRPNRFFRATTGYANSAPCFATVHVCVLYS